MKKEDVYGLTNPQKNIWQTEQVINKKSSINHIYAIMELDGVLDKELLEKTINKIIENNDSFRIKLQFNKGDAKQYIEQYKWVDIIKEEVKKDNIEKVIEQYKDEELSLNKLFAFKLVTTEENTYVFYKSHHIIADAWGMTQVAEQIKNIYKNLKNGEESNFQNISYISFIKREKEYKESQKYENDKTFWEKYVKQIKNDKLFNHTVKFNKKAERYEYRIKEKVFENISKYCKKNKLTEYSFFLGVISIYFNKISNIENLVIGTPFLNRQKKLEELKSTGMYVSTLPVNIHLQKEENFVGICKKIGVTNLSLYKHSKFPYYEIEQLYHKNTDNNSNIYDLVFSYQINQLENTINDKDSGICKWIFLGEQNNPLSIHLTTLNKYKIINYDYQISYFEKEDIEKMNEIIFHIINQILNNKEKLSDINTITQKDSELLNQINNTGNIKYKNENVIDIFNRVVNDYENKKAIICGEKNITYKELKKKVNNIAQELIKNGITKNTPVALFFDKSIDMIEAMFGVLAAGGCYVPILPDEDENRIRYIMNDCKANCILTHKDYKVKTNIKTINVDKINNNNTKTNINISNEDIAYIIYTSGSTGNPKGTMVTHKNICNLKYSIQNDNTLKATNKDISISLLKYSFDASGIDIYTSLLFGGTLILVEKEDELNPEKVLKIIEKYKVTRSFLIPKWIENIAIQDKLKNTDLSSLRILGTGGETLKPYILKNLLEKYKNLKVINLYGPTETTMFTTYKVISKKEIEENYTSIGKPIFGARIGVINKNNELMPINTKGELIIYEDQNSIKNIAKGYLNLEEITNKKFISIYNPIINQMTKVYKTGDIAKINDSLEIEFIGRDDDIVKINGGYLVALNEVENKIQKLLGENFREYPIAIPYKNTKIIILFLTKKEKNISLDNIKRYINKNISFYMKPKKIIELDEFPRNSSGKIDRKKLQKIAVEYMDRNKNELISPKTKIEKEIYKNIKKIISIDDFSINDDFIDDLGIDSLELTSLYTYLEKYNITIQDMYNYSNIKDLACFIQNSNNKKLQPDLSDIEEIKILNNVKKIDLTNIMITGVTGFLGIHILRDLLENKKTKKIYCIIRNKINLDGKERLLQTIDYYFKNDKKLISLIKEKVIVLDGDITKEKLGIDETKYNQLQNEITTVINSAANVRHFAKPNVIKKDNVQSVKELIEFCDENISLVHMSTLSIAAFKNENSMDKILNENTLYIKQDFKHNPYLITKFLAEKEILKATNNNKLNAIIFRVGNIMPRVEDGKFQKNEKQNVFIKALKAILDSKMIAKEILDLKLEFSPVDECSKIIIGLLENNNSNSIYHIINNKEITIRELNKIFEYYNCKIKIVNTDEFTKKIQRHTDQYTKEYILNHDLNKYSQKITLQEMKNRNLQWTQINNEYIKRVLNIIQKL